MVVLLAVDPVPDPAQPALQPDVGLHERVCVREPLPQDVLHAPQDQPLQAPAVPGGQKAAAGVLQ